MHPDGATEAAALRGVMVQRLLRRLCSACATPQLETELPELERSLLAEIPGGTVRRPVGCDECRGTGYRGRLAIVEVVPVTDALRQAIARRAIATELMQLVRAHGVPTLWDSGIEHVRAGATSLAELLDAVPPPERGTAAAADFDALLSEALAKPQLRRSSPRKKSSD
jgi:type II secretory ATPase GspE/PulE/Tfp pilus assembly ATPase PilB-like protein